MSIQDEAELEALREVGQIVAACLKAMRSNVRPGATTAELNAIAAAILRERKARSAPMLVYGFPAEVCISVNDEIVHGIPGERVLEAGDLVKLDVTAEKDGYMADAAVTVAVGEVVPRHRRLAACAERAFHAAMRVARAGNRVNDIGRAVEEVVRRDGFAVVRELCGHGIGRTIHEAPSVPNFFHPGNNALLTSGLVLTVEPILSAGSGRTVNAADGWTIRTADGAAASHHEHTLVITEGDPILLTAA